MIKEVRVHGRGGQGSVTAAEVLALASEKCGEYSQAYPKFGVERRGAPVIAYLRIDDNFIRTRSQIYHPEFIIVQDATLIGEAQVQEGLVKDTGIIINSDLTREDFKNKVPNVNNLYLVPATKMSIEIIGKAIVNTVLIGAFTAICDKLDLKGSKKAVKEYLKKKGFSKSIVSKNVKAVQAGYEYIKDNYKK